MEIKTSASTEELIKPRRKYRVMSAGEELKQAQEAYIILRQASQSVEIQVIKDVYKHDIFFSAHKNALVKEAKDRHQEENALLNALHRGQWMYLENGLNPYAFPFPTLSDENQALEEV